MKIDKKKLVELLVDRTGMEQTEVEDQLEQLINRIIDAAERGKALEIKEFGLFYFDEDGELKFDPATELSTEINFKYAGMEPVELKPPRDEDAGMEDIEISDEPDTAKREEEPVETEEELANIFGFDDDEGIDGKEEEEKIDPFAMDEEDEDTEPAPKKKKEEEPVSSETKKESSEEPEEDEEEDIKPREDDPFAGLLSDASTKLTASDKRDFDEGDDKELDDPLFAPPKPQMRPASKPEPKKEPAKAGTPPAGKRAASAPKKEAPGPKPKPAAARRTSEPKRDPIIVVIAVVLVFVLIAAGFLLIPGMFQTDDRELPPQQPPVTSEPAPVPEQEDAVNVLTPVEPGAETEVTDDVAAADEITPETQPEQPRYGLTGDLVEAANDGFSIVLHSLAREDNAREQAARLAADGYRVLVSPRTVQNQTVWRVSVGQFQTIADAQEHARELPSPYNTNNFIQRIQVN